MTASHILLNRIDPNRNMARYYEIELGTDLFGQPVVIRRWGRMGRLGRVETEALDTRAAAQARLDAMLRKKLVRGYRQVD